MDARQFDSNAMSFSFRKDVRSLPWLAIIGPRSREVDISDYLFPLGGSTLPNVPIVMTVPRGKEVRVRRSYCGALQWLLVHAFDRYQDPCSPMTMIRQTIASRSAFFALMMMASIILSGCNFIPDIKRKPQYHNPFPQISKVAVLPFRNQSQEPTLSGARLSMAYYNELQSIRGFEVIPFGVVENQLAYFETQILKRPISSPVDFQQFAKHLGVDAVLQGAVTDYDSYYPPRMTIKVNWYAANPGFHPIPVGYGLPWGTKKEKKIPEWIRLESERSLAAEQMKTQTPNEHPAVAKEAIPAEPAAEPNLGTSMPEAEERSAEKDSAEKDSHRVSSKANRIAAARIKLPIDAETEEEALVGSGSVHATALDEPDRMPKSVVHATEGDSSHGFADSTDSGSQQTMASDSQALPADWPDPQGFIPRRPTAEPPEMKPQFEPIISHMRSYNGNDEDFTHALGEYFYFRDDARFGGWQAYLQRSEDFIRFCCHQHIVETLESRGGALESRMILRWPIGRYER